MPALAKKLQGQLSYTLSQLTALLNGLFIGGSYSDRTIVVPPGLTLYDHTVDEEDLQDTQHGSFTATAQNSGTGKSAPHFTFQFAVVHYTAVKKFLEGCGCQAVIGW